MELTYDSFNRLEIPKVYLVSQDRKSQITLHVRNFSVRLSATEISEVNFDVDEYFNGVRNKYFDLIEGLRTIYIPDFGEKSYFQLGVPNETKEDLQSYKTCVGKTLEYQLTQKYITYFTINMGSDSSIDDVVLYNKNNPEHSLLNLILQDLPSWSVGEIDPAITFKQRSFEKDKQDIYSFLTTDVAQSFKCIFTFDTVNRKINATAVDNIGKDTDIHISLRNLAKRIEISGDEDSVFTRFYVQGYEDLDIRAVNLGSDYIEDYSYYATPEWLGSQETVDKYNNYLAIRETKRLEYINKHKLYLSLIMQYYELSNRLPSSPDSMEWSEYGLIELQTMETAYQNVVDIQIEAGQNVATHINYMSYNMNIQALNDIKSEVTVRENEIAQINIQIDNINNSLLTILQSVKKELFFTETELEIFSSLEINTDYQDDSFVVTDSMADEIVIMVQEELYNTTLSEITKLSQPQYYFNTDISNLFAIPEFQSVSGNFDLFSFITLSIRDDYHIRLRLMTMNIDFNDITSLSVEFSNMVKSRDSFDDFMSLVDTSISNSISSISRKMNSNVSGVQSSVDSLGQEVKGSVVTENLMASQAYIHSLNAVDAKIHSIEADYLTVENAAIEYLNATEADIRYLNAIEADIKYLTVESADIKYANIEQLDVINGNFDILNADLATIDTLVNGNLTSENIKTLNLTSLNTTISNAMIKDAMIDSVSVDKILAGTILTNKIGLQSESGNFIIQDNTIQISDDTKVRVQIGKDASGDYSLYVWDILGNLMFDANGINENAIKDSIIRDDMVAINANISGSKINIESLITNINDDNTKTINGSKILVNPDGQTLDISFNSMTSQIDGISDDLTTQGTQISAVQGQITSKVWQTDIDSTLSDYTDVIAQDISTLQSQIDGSITTWFYEYEPTMANIPASDWTTNDVRNVHLGDLFYNTISGYVYRYQLINTVYSWEKITDTDITKALETAQKAQDTADNKRRVFTTQPIPPYDIGDLWSEGINGDLYKCKITRATGGHISTDWEKAVKYTDDTIANENLIAAISYTDAIEIGGRNLLANSNFSEELLNTEWWVRGTTYTITIDTLETYQDKNSMKIVGTGIGAGSQDIQITSYLLSETNKEYYISFYAKADVDCVADCRWGYGTSIDSKQLSTEWKKYKIKLVGSTPNKYIFLWFNMAGTIWINSPKLEKGNKATDWTPAPEDVQSQIDNQSTRITTAESSITQNANAIISKVSQTDVNTSIANIQVGGRNLLPNTSMFTNTIGWSGATLDSIDGYSTLKVEGTMTEDHRIPLEPNTEYIVAIDIYPSVDIPITESTPLHTYFRDSVSVNNARQSAKLISKDTVAKANLWTRIILLVKTKAELLDGSYFKLHIYYPSLINSVTPVWVKDIQFIKGNIATDWSPAPEDKVSINTIISEINQSAEEIKIQANKISLIGAVNIVGGADNVNGVLKVFDANDIETTTIDVSGITTNSLNFVASTSVGYYGGHLSINYDGINIDSSSDLRTWNDERVYFDTLFLKIDTDGIMLFEKVARTALLDPVTGEPELVSNIISKNYTTHDYDGVSFENSDGYWDNDPFNLIKYYIRYGKLSYNMYDENGYPYNSSSVHVGWDIDGWNIDTWNLSVGYDAKFRNSIDVSGDVRVGNGTSQSIIQLYNSPLDSNLASRVEFKTTDGQDVQIRHNSHDSVRASFGLHIEKTADNTSTDKAYLDVEGDVYVGGNLSVGRRLARYAQATDLNNIIDEWILGVNGSNFPASGYWYVHTILYGSESQRKQIAYGYQINNVYTRYMYHDVWSSWSKLSTDGHTHANLGNTNMSSSATANTIAYRDAAGDITTRLFRSTYANESAISGAIAFRKSTTDNYIRFCSSPSAVTKWLGVGDSGWINLPLNNGTLTYASGHEPKCRRLGNVVNVQGQVKLGTALTITTADHSRTMCTLPVGYRPNGQITVLCQGSSSEIWLLSIDSTGTMSVSRYRTAASYKSITTSTWLPFSTTFSI